MEIRVNKEEIKTTGEITCVQGIPCTVENLRYLLKENAELRKENFELCAKALAADCVGAMQKAIGKHGNGFKSITVNEKKRIVTVVFNDGDVRMSKCSKSDHFDVSVGVALCVSQHLFGSKTNFHKKIEKAAKYVGGGKKIERKKQ